MLKLFQAKGPVAVFSLLLFAFAHFVSCQLASCGGCELRCGSLTIVSVCLLMVKKFHAHVCMTCVHDLCA